MITIVALVTYRALEWMMAASRQGDYVSCMVPTMPWWVWLTTCIFASQASRPCRLREAVEHGDYAKVGQLIDKGVNLHTCIDSVSKAN